MHNSKRNVKVSLFLSKEELDIFHDLILFYKNTVQRIESEKQFMTDIELKVIPKVLDVSYQDLLDD